jgi:hypothetical protein
MTRHAVPRVRWHRRWLRGLWPDRNPLRRAADRVEAAVVAGLLAAFAIGAPLAALFAGHWSYAVALRVEHVQQSTWRQVPAVLLGDAPYAGYSGYGVDVRARWTAQNGVRRSGVISVPGGAGAGSTALIWVDASGGLVGPPLRHAQVIGQATMAMVLTPVGLGVLLVCAGVVAHSRLERRRLATWDAEWRVTGPQWTKLR